MADIAQSLKSWSSTLGSNLPTSSSTIGTGLAPNLQQIQSTLRYELGSRSASITALATTDIGVQDEGTILILNASGTVAITSFGIVSAGIKKLVTFNVTGGGLSLTYNASSMILPSAANINVLTGDSLLAESLGAGNWKIHAYYKNDGSSITGVAISALQTQLYTAFTTAGTSALYTLTPIPALTALTTNSRFNVLFNVAPTGSPTLAVSGLTAKSIKYYDATGVKQFITSAQVPINWDTDVIYDGTDWVVQTTLPLSVNSKIQSVTATQSAGALTFGLAASMLDYRSTTLTNGATTTVTNAALSLVLPSGGTLGFATATQGRVVLVVLNNAGVSELAISNLAGGNNFDETSLINTIPISQQSTFTGSIAVTTGVLTISATGTGIFALGQALSGTGITQGTYVIALLTGTLGASLSTYSTNTVVAIASTVMTGTAGIGVYSVTARTSVAYRNAGFVDAVNTAGAWATPLFVQGAGGQALQHVGAILNGTAVSTTAGTSIDFTGIPSFAKRITMMLNGVSTNGVSNPQIQIGAGSIDTAGYISTLSSIGTSTISSTTGCGINSAAAANLITGILTITLISANTWIFALIGQSNASQMIISSATKTLSGNLDRIRLTTVNGTDTFDAGSVNILYE